MTEHRVDFPGMHPDERIVLLQRRHWTMLGRKLLRYLLLLALPFIILFLLSWSNVDFTVDTKLLSGVAIVLGISVYALVMWLLFFHDWLDYYLDAFIMTNKRIVRIEQHGLFDRVVSDLQLEKVQDVTVETKGIGSTFLRYGTIHVQSAAELGRFVFSAIPNPENIKAAILAAISSGASQNPSRLETRPPAEKITGTP